VGRAVAALTADPDVLAWSGETLTCWGLTAHTVPDWGAHFRGHVLADA
jgi:hypothetical protein